MGTINDLYLNENGFIACKENQTSNEWCKLLSELFKDWKQLKAKIEVQRIELLNYAVNVCPDLDSQIEQLKEKEIRGDRLLVKYSHQIDVLKAELKAAKEMEKQQIEQAFADGVDDEYEWHINNQPRTDAEQYYNETFNQ